MSKQISQLQLDFKDVLIQPAKSALSSRSQVNLVSQYHFKHSPYTYSGTPIIVANMDTTGTMGAATVMAQHHCMTALHKHYSIDQLTQFFTVSSNEQELFENNQHRIQHSFYSMGIVNSDLEKFQSVVKQVGIGQENGIKMVCIDVANGYMSSFQDFCKYMRDTYPDLIIMAGNVVDADITSELLAQGVDIVKVGIGSGSVCQTRVVAGTGRPQFSAILDCQEAAQKAAGYTVSDGGITCIADFSKAFAAGCFGVMAGGIFSGHQESEGQIIQKEGKQFLEFYGMSSETAMDKYSGGLAKYKASEGKKVYIPFKGSLENTISSILGGVRSAHTYVGANNLNQFRKNAQFYRVSQEVNEIYGSSKL